MAATASQPFLCARGHTQAEPDARFCAECGAAILPAATSGAPACAVHPHVRAEQACPRCGSFACRACLQYAPDGSLLCATCQARESTTEVPWDQRAEKGTLSSFFRTCWLITLHPIRTLDHARPDGRSGGSLWFAMLAYVTSYLTTFIAYFAMMAVAMGGYLFGSKAGERTLTPATTAGITVGTGALFVAVFLAMALGATLLFAFLDHLVLKLAGAKPRSFDVTLRAFALSMSPCLAGLVPFCGVYVMPVWAAVIRVFAYRGLHRTTTGKAVAGALAVPGTILVLVFASWVALIAMASAQGKN